MKRNERTKLILFAVGLTLLLVARDIMEISMSKYVYLAFCAAFFLIAEYRTLVGMICFTLPLACGIPSTYIMTAALVVLIIKSRRINLWQIILIMAVVIMELFASAWYPETDIASIVQYSAFAGIVFFLSHDWTEMDYNTPLRMYLYSTCILCVLIIAMAIIDAPSNWIERLATGQFRFGQTHHSKNDGMALFLNANGLAFYSAIGVCVGIFLADRCKGVQQAWLIGLTVLAATGGVLSITRTWVFVVGICLFFYILGKVRHPKRLLGAVFALGIVGLSVFLIMGEESKLMEAILEAFNTRFTDDNMATGNGRTDLFAAYMEVFLADIRILFFGAGVTQYRTTTGDIQSIHNGIQQILVCCGLIGFVIYMFGMFQPVLASRRRGKKPIVYWIPLVSILLCLQTTQFLSMQMLPYVIAVFALKMGGTEDA